MDIQLTHTLTYKSGRILDITTNVANTLRDLMISENGCKSMQCFTEKIDVLLIINVLEIESIKAKSLWKK